MRRLAVLTGLIGLMACAKKGEEPTTRQGTSGVPKVAPAMKGNPPSTSQRGGAKAPGKSPMKPTGGAKMAFTVTSKSWPEKGTIAKRHILEKKGGQNVSPQVTLDAPPKGTKSLLLVVVDHHKVARDWLHWVALLPPGVTRLKEGASSAMPEGATQLPNTWGRAQYDGPAPPPGGPHDYHLKVFALNGEPKLSGKITWTSIQQAIQGQVLAEAELVGYYESK